MPRTIIRRLLLYVVTLTIAFATASADWPTEIDTAVPLCTAYSGQSYSSMVEDGLGNYLVVWTDYREGTGRPDIYMQRFGANGTPHWDIDGEHIVTPMVGIYNRPIVVPDDVGGAYVVFEDAPSGSYVEVFVQHVDANGTVLWNNPIILVPSEEEISTRVNATAVKDGFGNVIVAFQDFRSGGVPDIWAQRIMSNGNLDWGDEGVLVCGATGTQRFPEAVSMEAGGAIIAWEDYRDDVGNGIDLYMQRVDVTGTLAWANDGKSLAVFAEDQYSLSGAPDGNGGALFAWLDRRSGDNWDVYVQRVSPDNGNTWWSLSGVPACNQTDDQGPPVVISDGHGGAFLAWQDSRTDSFDYPDIYGQHVANSGSALWSTSGLFVGGSESTNGTYGIDLLQDGHDGVFIVWSGTVGAGAYHTDLLGQRLNSEGWKYWDYYGQAIATQSGNQNHPSIAAHPEGGIVMAFETLDNLDDWNIYASYVDDFGYPGDVSPSISGIMDFPQDQGGVVILSWLPSYRDNIAQGIDDYTVWKRLHLFGAEILDPAEQAHAMTSGLPEWKVADLLRTGWTYVDAIDAAFQEEYAYDAPTYGDTTDEETIYTDYKVIARQSENVFWESDVEMGSSVDNLAPGAPLNLAAIVDGSDVDLSWSASGYHDEDLAIYRLYRSDMPGFTPDVGNFLAMATDTTFVDASPGAGLWYYLVTAQDVHGNEGAQSNEAMAELITAIEDGGSPSAFALRGNWPNPFNPKTSIGFDLPTAGRVRLEVFDSTGRRVALLLDEHLEAGSYHENWRGLDDAGADVASGVYLARVSFGMEAASHRMLLLK